MIKEILVLNPVKKHIKNIVIKNMNLNFALQDINRGNIININIR